MSAFFHEFSCFTRYINGACLFWQIDLEEIAVLIEILARCIIETKLWHSSLTLPTAGTGWSVWVEANHQQKKF